ncbi:MAG: hypothetical protein LBB18_02480 [Puniceicoccales bacterium]|jgi:hypothetical protein|nr:hypothetical protein [Puniceicoccales bacterium]
MKSTQTPIPQSTLILNNSIGHIGSAKGEAAFLANITTGSANNRIDQPPLKVRPNPFQKAGENNSISSPGSGSLASNSTGPGTATHTTIQVQDFGSLDMACALNTVRSFVDASKTIYLSHKDTGSDVGHAVSRRAVFECGELHFGLNVDTVVIPPSKGQGKGKVEQKVSITCLSGNSNLHGMSVGLSAGDIGTCRAVISKFITVSMTKTNEKNVPHSTDAFELHGEDGVMECKEIPSEGSKEALKKYMNEKIGVFKEICEKVGKDTAVSTKIHVRIGNLDITMNMSKGGKGGKGTTINCVMESPDGKGGKQVSFTGFWNKGNGFNPIWNKIKGALEEQSRRQAPIPQPPLTLDNSTGSLVSAQDKSAFPVNIIPGDENARISQPPHGLKSNPFLTAAKRSNVAARGVLTANGKITEVGTLPPQDQHLSNDKLAQSQILPKKENPGLDTDDYGIVSYDDSIEELNSIEELEKLLKEAHDTTKTNKKSGDKSVVAREFLFSEKNFKKRFKVSMEKGTSTKVTLDNYLGRRVELTWDKGRDLSLKIKCALYDIGVLTLMDLNLKSGSVSKSLGNFIRHCHDEIKNLGPTVEPLTKEWSVKINDESPMTLRIQEKNGTEITFVYRGRSNSFAWDRLEDAGSKIEYALGEVGLTKDGYFNGNKTNLSDENFHKNSEKITHSSGEMSHREEENIILGSQSSRVSDRSEESYSMGSISSKSEENDFEDGLEHDAQLRATLAKVLKKARGADKSVDAGNNSIDSDGETVFDS